MARHVKSTGKAKSTHNSSSQKSKPVSIGELDWKAVDVPDTLGDYEGFFGLEEIQGIGVLRDQGQVKFLKHDLADDSKTETSSKRPRLDDFANFPDEDYESLKDLSESDSSNDIDEHVKTAKKRKTKAPKEQQLMEVDFSNLDNDVSEAPDTWGLGLSANIQAALAALNLSSPTDIQKEAIPSILLGKNVVGKAATGSGKTFAYGLPILHRHFALKQEQESKTWPTGIIFAPTRELAHQISDHLKKVLEHCGDKRAHVVPITGGLSIQKQQRLLSKCPAAVVATPGRFLEFLQSSNEITEMFRKAEILVLDEADRLIQDGHFDELEKILDLLGRAKRQTCVFSATFDKKLMGKLTKRHNARNDRDSLLKLLKDRIRFDAEPVYIDVNPNTAVAKKVVEAVIECGALEKDLFLYYFCLAYPARTLVFLNSIHSVRRLTPLLKELGLEAFGIHSDMIQKKRLRSLEQFKKKEHAVLLATDVAARGLDIPLVDHVVHYHVPRSADTYVHRSGRTARAGTDGVSVILCSPDEALPLNKLQKLIKNNISQLEVDYDMVSSLKLRLKLAKTITEQAASSSHSNDWLKEAADDLGADLDDLEVDQSTKSKKQVSADKHEVKALRAQLSEELKRPVGFRTKYVTSGAANIAHILLTGKSHQEFLGHEQKSAIENIRKH